MRILNERTVSAKTYPGGDQGLARKALRARQGRRVSDQEDDRAEPIDISRGMIRGIVQGRAGLGVKIDRHASHGALG